MFKDEFIKRICERLDESEARKHVKLSGGHLKISDENGNKTSFKLPNREREVVYNTDDCEKIINAAMDVITEAVLRNDDVNITGFGRLYLNHLMGRPFYHPVTKEMTYVDDRYSVKLKPGKRLLVAAEIYRQSVAPTDDVFVSEADAIFDKLDNDGGDE